MGGAAGPRDADGGGVLREPKPRELRRTDQEQAGRRGGLRDGHTDGHRAGDFLHVPRPNGLHAEAVEHVRLLRDRDFRQHLQVLRLRRHSPHRLAPRMDKGAMDEPRRKQHHGDVPRHALGCHVREDVAGAHGDGEALPVRGHEHIRAEGAGEPEGAGVLQRPHEDGGGIPRGRDRGLQGRLVIEEHLRGHHAEDFRDGRVPEDGLRHRR